MIGLNEGMNERGDDNERKKKLGKGKSGGLLGFVHLNGLVFSPFLLLLPHAPSTLLSLLSPPSSHMASSLNSGMKKASPLHQLFPSTSATNFFTLLRLTLSVVITNAASFLFLIGFCRME